MTAELKIRYMPEDESESASPSGANDAPTAGGTTPAAGSGDNAADLQRLWRRVQEDDQLAFEQVYRLCSGPVYGLCLRMTANRAAADDCAQSTFLQAWEKRQSFRGEASLPTWLHRIAVNMVLGRGRREGRLREVIDEYAQDTPLWTHSDSAEDALLDRELERAIATLPERGRQVFVLHALHGYKHSEVGEMMGIAAGTCKAHYHRSRELLQQHLAQTPNAGSDSPPSGAQV